MENNPENLPEPSSLQAVIGALIFSADRPLEPTEIRAALKKAAEKAEPDSCEKIFAKASISEIKALLKDIQNNMTHSELGIRLTEIDGRFAFRTIPGCGKWLRMLLKVESPQRLSRASLETLSIIAYRQPVSKAEMESIRGVAVDHIVRALLELNLIRTVGRSELPGRPFLYGTTSTFLEHFGLKNISELDTFDPTMQRFDPAEQKKRHSKKEESMTDEKQSMLNFDGVD